MAFETGGREDQLGNRHEGWWVAKQLLRLFNVSIVNLPTTKFVTHLNILVT